MFHQAASRSPQVSIGLTKRKMSVRRARSPRPIRRFRDGGLATAPQSRRSSAGFGGAWCMGRAIYQRPWAGASNRAKGEDCGENQISLCVNSNLCDKANLVCEDWRGVKESGVRPQ